MAPPLIVRRSAGANHCLPFRKSAVLPIVFALLFTAEGSRGDVFNMGPDLTSLESVHVGHPGNVADTEVMVQLDNGCAGSAAAPVLAAETRLRPDVTLEKPEDRVTEHVHDGRTIFSIHSPSGIGRATIHRESWPDHVSLRLYLRGLEGLTIENGSVALKASVLSHSGHRRLLRVVRQGQEKVVKDDSPYRTEIRAFDAAGKPIEGLPGENGYFEMVLPGALFEGEPKSLCIGWIDFYRQ